MSISAKVSATQGRIAAISADPYDFENQKSAASDSADDVMSEASLIRNLASQTKSNDGDISNSASRAKDDMSQSVQSAQEKFAASLSQAETTLQNSIQRAQEAFVQSLENAKGTLSSDMSNALGQLSQHVTTITSEAQKNNGLQDEIIEIAS